MLRSENIEHSFFSDLILSVSWQEVHLACKKELKSQLCHIPKC